MANIEKLEKAINNLDSEIDDLESDIEHLRRRFDQLIEVLEEFKNTEEGQR